MLPPLVLLKHQPETEPETELEREPEAMKQRMCILRLLLVGAPLAFVACVQGGDLGSAVRAADADAGGAGRGGSAGDGGQSGGWGGPAGSGGESGAWASPGGSAGTGGTGGIGGTGGAAGSGGNAPDESLGTLKLTYPNGGETLIGGTVCTITWESSMTFSNIHLEYKLAPESWVVIDDTVTDTGSYEWTVPDIDLAKSRIWMGVGTSNHKPVDSSDDWFAITRAHAPVAPPGVAGE